AGPVSRATNQRGRVFINPPHGKNQHLLSIGRAGGRKTHGEFAGSASLILSAQCFLLKQNSPTY
ncbi:MAG TPA: hypothetical protein VG099_21880, partial [Gemmataceae bacterium]|nr:hypothetical protein [Gemmataceae bacterium]